MKKVSKIETAKMNSSKLHHRPLINIGERKRGGGGGEEEEGGGET